MPVHLKVLFVSVTCSYEMPCYPGNCLGASDCACERGFKKSGSLRREFDGCITCKLRRFSVSARLFRKRKVGSSASNFSLFCSHTKTNNLHLFFSYGIPVPWLRYLIAFLCRKIAYIFIEFAFFALVYLSPLLLT